MGERSEAGAIAVAIDDIFATAAAAPADHFAFKVRPAPSCKLPGGVSCGALLSRCAQHQVANCLGVFHVDGLAYVTKTICSGLCV